MSLVEQIGIFVLFLGPLVFFHELGHFLFARLFGVKVEVFSIGFGPKILKKKWGDTEYALSIIPLGGYVKMFGDDPLKKDEIPSSERQMSFTHKGKWARFWIVFGGPLANFIFAYAIFFLLLLVGEKVPKVKLGFLAQDSKLYQLGFRSSDELKNINGQVVESISEVALIETDKVNQVTVIRKDSGGDKTVVLPTAGQISAGELLSEMSKSQPLLDPIFYNAQGEKFQLQNSDKEIVPLQLLISGKYVMVSLDKKENQINTPLVLGPKPLEELRSSGFYPAELMVKKVVEDLPAFNSGIRSGDIITGIDGAQIYNFDALRSAVNNKSKSNVSLEVDILRKQQAITFSMTAEEREINGVSSKIIGVENQLNYLPVGFLHTESKGLIGSFTGGFSRTWKAIIQVTSGFKKLLTGEVPLDKIGGPVSIGKVASDSFNLSLSMFLVFMALVSINLGLINLFPIPVLDGGHILFIGLEILNRGPLSRRKMEIAQQVGLSILLLLMFFALRNDFKHFISFS